MTATIPTTPDAARAADLDCARERYRTFPIHDRPTFGDFAVNFLRGRGLEVVPAPEPAPCCAKMPDGDHSPYCPRKGVEAPPVPNGKQLAELLGLLRPVSESPFFEQAVAMSVEEIADLLAALAERGLRWLPGEGGPDAECGTLIDGPAEPADLHVVFDCFGTAWQRDNTRAEHAGNPFECWFGTGNRHATWDELQRDLGPLTPDGGVAPPQSAQ